MGPFKWNENDECKNLCRPQMSKDGVYIGYFDEAGMRHGRGIHISHNGTKYVGYWNLGKRDGRGRRL